VLSSAIIAENLIGDTREGAMKPPMKLGQASKTKADISVAEIEASS
jgi:hypothetical protein